MEVLPPPVEPELPPPAEAADFVEAAPSEAEIPDPVAEFAETPAEVPADAPAELAEDAFDPATDPLISEPAEDSTAQFAEQAAAEALEEPMAQAADPVVREEAPVEPPPAPVEETPAQPFRAVLPDAGQALPAVIDVEQGDTLWGLSGAYAEAEGVSRNQVMLAVQQKNPNAFIGDNINALMAGEILRMPTRDEMLAQDARQAMLEVMRQESLYRTRWDLPPSPDQLPTLANLADAGSSTATRAEPGAAASAALDAELPADEPMPAEAEQALASSGSEAVDEDSRLVLVPPSENESETTQGMGQGGSGETGVSSGESVVEELARAREELANAEQEKAYLEERLAELEAELARREATETSGVADTNLAEMEDRLREDRLSGAEEPEVLMPRRESSWLSSYGPALAGLIVLALVTLVWFLRSRRNPEYTAGIHEPVSGVERDSDVHENPTDSNGAESDDPETLLDLARAYMAMGKNTQARDCIEAVTRVGTPTQVREARTMLTDL